MHIKILYEYNDYFKRCMVLLRLGNILLYVFNGTLKDSSCIKDIFLYCNEGSSLYYHSRGEVDSLREGLCLNHYSCFLVMRKIRW